MVFKCLRCIVFGIFIICNAVVASIAVWNHSLSQSVVWNAQSQVDIYLAFVGCLGLALIFPLLFTELVRKDWITGRIWFECFWVCLFWTLYLAGATTVTAITPSTVCKVPDHECTSVRVIMAFTWTTTAILLLYLLLLLTLSVMHSKYEPRIWQSYIRKSPWSGRHSLSSTPTSPARPHFLKKSPSIVAPKPQRAVPPAIYGYRSGLGPEYEIEHYHPPTPVIRPEPVLAASSTVNHVEAKQQENTALPSLYPQYMHSTTTIQSPYQAGQRNHSPPSPPPLGDWPRPNIVMEPVRLKKKNPGLVLNPTPAPNTFM